MTYHNDFTLPSELLEQIASEGLDFIPTLIEIFLNAAMQAERSKHLRADPYERTSQRNGYANGYKPKTVKTRLGELSFEIPQVRDSDFYPGALEKGLRSERALTMTLAEMYVQGVSTRKVKAITEKGLDSRHFILCTDDIHAETLVNEGHMDRVLRHTIAQGVDPLTAIQMATLNTAEHFGLTRDMGQIAPGRYADVLLVSDLHDFRAELVIAQGRVLAQDGKWLIDLPSVDYPAWATKSVHLKRELTAEDFRLPVSGLRSPLIANVIGVIESQAPTRHLRLPVEAKDGEVRIDLERDLAKIALVERHKATGRVQVGLVQGFGLGANCAIATTVAHDCHNMIVVGTDEENMAQAANAVAAANGGQAVVKDGEVIGQVSYPSPA